MLNIRTTFLSVVLVLILMLSVRLVTAGTDAVSDPSNDSVPVIENQLSTNQNKAPLPSYRSPLEECFDVSLREAASCQKANQAPVGLNRPPRDVCIDVPIGGAVTCPMANPTLTPFYRSPLDECFDVSISELASCRNASQAPVP